MHLRQTVQQHVQNEQLACFRDALVDFGAPVSVKQAWFSGMTAANNLVVFYGAEGLSYEQSDTLARMLGNLLLLKRDDAALPFAGRPNNGLVPVGRHANAQGARDMGIHPALGPGHSAAPEALSLVHVSPLSSE